jgi:mannose-1-phosphate guanylyltransferase/phosphomannomutase
MKALILAAGMGERLRPLTNEIPKPLIPVANRPLIEYNLQLLKTFGIEEVAINLHYMGDKIRDHLGYGQRLGLKIVYSPEPVLLGSGGGIKKMLSFLGPESFLVINADILIDVDLKAVVQFHRAKQAMATMVVRPNPDPVRYGTIEADDTGRIRNFLGKVTTPDPGLHQWMFTGIHVFEPRAMDYLPNLEHFCINRDVYAQWIRSEKPCYAYIHRGYWKDLGTLEDYFEANMDLLENRGIKNPWPRNEDPDLNLGDGVSLERPYLIGDSTEIADKTAIGPQTVIGSGSSIGKGARIERSIVWPRTSIEDREQIAGMIATPYQRILVEDIALSSLAAPKQK